MAEQPDKPGNAEPARPAPALSKSKNPSYVKFTTYVPRETHMRVKSLAVRHGLELSALVARLLDEWLERQEGERR